MLAPMDGLVIAFVALQAVALAIALAVAWSRGRTIEAIEESLDEAERAGLVAHDTVAGSQSSGRGAGPADDELPDRLRRLRRRADDAEFQLDQRLRDLTYLADLVGVRIVRLTDDLRVEVANTAAMFSLRRDRGRCSGGRPSRRSAITGSRALPARLARQAGQVEMNLTDESGADQRPGANPRRPRRRSPISRRLARPRGCRRARRLQRIRAEFIDNLSHELRTPITTIGLLVESLARDADPAGETAVPPKMRERIGKLEVETGSIAQMVAELLDLARIESGGRQLHLDDVDLGRIAVDPSTDCGRCGAAGRRVAVGGGRGPAAGAGRGGAAGAGVRRRPQRGEVQPGRHGGGWRCAGGPDAGGLGRGRRTGRVAGGPGAHLRTLHQGGPDADLRWRDRPGPG